MTEMKQTLLLPLSLVTLVLILGATAWAREPEGGIAFAIAMFMLPVAWPVIEMRYRRKTLDDAGREDLATVRYSVAGAALMMAVPLAMTLAISFGITEALGDELEKRTVGVLVGTLFLVYGNYAPKRPVSMTNAGCTPAQRQAQTRFAGRMFMLTGLIYVAVWIFAPIAWTLPLGMAVMIGGVGLTMLRAFTMKHG